MAVLLSFRKLLHIIPATVEPTTTISEVYNSKDQQIISDKWYDLIACDGVRDWRNSKNRPVSFVFWTLVLITLMCACGWFTYRVIIGYIESPRVTSIETVAQTSLELPEILLCYNGGLNVSSFRKYNVSNKFIQAFNAYVQREIVENVQEVDSELRQLLNHSKKNLFDLALEFGFSCEDFVTSIIKGKYTFAVKLNCAETETLLTSSGNCFAFKKKLNQTYPALSNGYNIRLKEPKNSYLEIFPNESLGLNLNSEFEIVLEKSIGSGKSSRSVLVPIKTKVQIVLNPKRFVRLEEDGTRCSNSMTTSNDCYFNCIAITIQRDNNCASANYFPDDLEKVVDNICTSFAVHPNITNVRKCNVQCKPTCDEWLYDPTVNYSPLNNALTSEPISLVTIGYSSMQYNKIEEVKSFTIDMAISNVGGQSGLWLGLSAVTLVQSINYFVLWAYNKCVAVNRSKNENQESE